MANLYFHSEKKKPKRNLKKRQAYERRTTESESRSYLSEISDTISKLSSVINIEIGISLFIAILIAVILYWIYGVVFESVCNERECCQNPWVKHDFDHLSDNLTLDFFGQHLVTENIIKILKAHIKNEQTKKPLVLSFHGSPGTGKTFVSKLIAESFYKFGMSSKHAVFFNIQEHDENYEQVTLKRTIEYTVWRCKYALFIFEEAYLMNSKLLDVILSYINYPSLSYNRAIFLFLSKSGADSINDYVIDKMKEGRKRESITLEEMHNLLHSYIKTEKPFNDTEFVAQNLVDAYIPFLPLEKQHVRECVYAIMRQKHIKFKISWIVLQVLFLTFQIHIHCLLQVAVRGSST